MLTCKRIIQCIVLTLVAGTAIVVALSLYTSAPAAEPVGNSAASPIKTVTGMPPVVDPHNVYSETQAGKLSPAVNGALPRVYVPNRQSNDVTVIDPATLNPQHVVPSWDLKTLWVANNAEHRIEGSLTPGSRLTCYSWIAEETERAFSSKHRCRKKKTYIDSYYIAL
jgi:DNA-binding beta-propeller fold protein YncE